MYIAPVEHGIITSDSVVFGGISERSEQFLGGIIRHNFLKKSHPLISEARANIFLLLQMTPAVRTRETTLTQSLSVQELRAPRKKKKWLLLLHGEKRAPGLLARLLVS